jgi:hypothetical protein
MQLNTNGKLTHMVAKDMFSKSMKQVFCAKSGKWIATIRAWEDAPEVKQVPEVIEEKQINKNQLQLF